MLETISESKKRRRQSESSRSWKEAKRDMRQHAKFKETELVFTPELKLPVSKTDLTRIIAQALLQLGLKESVKAIEAETGIEMESSSLLNFRNEVLHGKWKCTCISLSLLFNRSNNNLNEKATRKLYNEKLSAIKLKLMQQHFYELLAERNVEAALGLLREDITPLASGPQVRLISRLLLVDEVQVPSRHALWGEICALLPHDVIVPENALLSLIEPCVAAKGNLWCDPPLVTKNLEIIQVIGNHDSRSEVWCVKFSSCGKYIVTSGNDCSIQFYGVSGDAILHLQCIKLHKAAVFALSWNGIYLLSADEGGAILLQQIQDQKLTKKLWVGEGMTNVVAACWAHQHILVARQDYKLYLYGMNGECISSFATACDIYDLSFCILKSLVVISSSCATRPIRFFRLEMEVLAEVPSKLSLLNPMLPISSLFVSANYLFTTAMEGSEIVRWDMNNETAQVIFGGCFHGRCIIRASCNTNGILASGTVDGKICIWNSNHPDTKPVIFIGGHTQPVNALDWNPCVPSMLVSVSDDGMLRHWNLISS